MKRFITLKDFQFKMRITFALTALLFALLCSTASAQIVKIEMNPQILLPNDIADCKLILTPTQTTYVSGITFFTPTEIEVIPSSISGVGWLTSTTSYEFPFTIKAKKSGIYTITIYINTLNGTIKQSMVVVVENKMPEIVLDKTVLTLNEVNEIGFTIVSPLSISNVVVKPLFDANPKVIYVENNKGSFKYLPKNATPLKFKITFYNGRNYHEVIRTVQVQYIESKGVLVNVTPQYPITLIGDVLPINVQIANLRGDTIYSIKVKTSAIPKTVEIPVIKPDESKTLKFDFCPNSGGVKEVKVEVEYRDEFNNKYTLTKTVKIRVSNETTVQFSGIDVKTEGEISLTGDVSNNGRTKVYNILITAIADGETKTYYIDSLEPSDFDSFEFTFTNASKIILKAQWNNEIGETFEKSVVVEVPAKKIVIQETQFNIIHLVISIVVFVFIVILIVVAWRKR